MTEYVAPGLDTISFDIKVSAVLGVNPRTTLDYWMGLAAAGQPNILCVGNKVLGTDQWIIKSATDKWQQLDGQGNILLATMSLVFEEYVST
jgi:hypothetical protein